MKKLWLLSAISKFLPSWSGLIALFVAVLTGYFQVNQAMNIFTSIAIRILVIFAIVVFSINAVYHVLSEKCRQDFNTSINNLIKQGNELREEIYRRVYRPFFPSMTTEEVDQQIEKWDQRTQKVISDYNSDWISWIQVNTLRASPIQWIDERITKLNELLSRS